MTTFAYRLRFRFVTGERLRMDGAPTTISVGGRSFEVGIEEEYSNSVLAKASSVVLEAGSFATREKAEEFGHTLREIVHLAGLCAGIGVDTGRDRADFGVNESALREAGALPPHARLQPDLHGIMIYPDDGNSSLFRASGRITVKQSPQQLLGAVEELSGPPSVPRVVRAVQLLNLALVNPESPGEDRIGCLRGRRNCRGPELDGRTTPTPRGARGQRSQ